MREEVAYYKDTQLLEADMKCEMPRQVRRTSAGKQQEQGKGLVIGMSSKNSCMYILFYLEEGIDEDNEEDEGVDDGLVANGSSLVQASTQDGNATNPIVGEEVNVREARQSSVIEMHPISIPLLCSE